jgi:hypothetical protein
MFEGSDWPISDRYRLITSTIEQRAEPILVLPLHPH